LQQLPRWHARCVFHPQGDDGLISITDKITALAGSPRISDPAADYKGMSYEII
jgi:hypothetical protein